MLSAAWGGSPANEGPETGIKSLCHRFHHASSKQDQQDLVEDLTVHAKEHPDVVGQNALPVFIAVLDENEQHEDLTQSILELLLEVLGGRPDVGTAADGIAAAQLNTKDATDGPRAMAQLVVSNTSWVDVLLKLLAHRALWTRLLTIQILTALHIATPARTGSSLLACGGGMMRLLDVLSDSREEIRNELLLLLSLLTYKNMEMQTFLAFQDGFPRLSAILETETYRGVIVDDILRILLNIVDGNGTAQQLLVDSPCLASLLCCLQLDEGDIQDGAISAEAQRVLLGALAVLSACTQCSLLTATSPHAEQAGSPSETAALLRARARNSASVQSSMGAHPQLLEAVAHTALSPLVPPPVTAAALHALADLVRRHEGNQGALTLLTLLPDAAKDAAVSSLSHPPYTQFGASVLAPETRAALSKRQPCTTLVMAWTAVMRLALVGPDAPVQVQGVGQHTLHSSVRLAAWDAMAAWLSSAPPSGKATGDTSSVTCLSHMLAPPPLFPTPEDLPPGAPPGAIESPAPVVPPGTLLLQVLQPLMAAVAQDMRLTDDEVDVFSACCRMLCVVLGTSSTAREVASAVRVGDPAVPAGAEQQRVPLLQAVLGVAQSMVDNAATTTVHPAVVASVFFVLSVAVHGSPSTVKLVWGGDFLPAAMACLEREHTASSQAQHDASSAPVVQGMVSLLLAASALAESNTQGGAGGLESSTMSLLQRRIGVSRHSAMIGSLNRHPLLKASAGAWKRYVVFLGSELGLAGDSNLPPLQQLVTHAGELQTHLTAPATAAEAVMALQLTARTPPQGTAPGDQTGALCSPCLSHGAVLVVVVRAAQAALKHAIVQSYLSAGQGGAGGLDGEASALDPQVAAELITQYKDIIRSQLAEIQSLRDSGATPLDTSSLSLPPPPANEGGALQGENSKLTLQIQAQSSELAQLRAQLADAVSAPPPTPPASDSSSELEELKQRLQAALVRAADAEEEVEVLRADVDALAATGGGMGGSARPEPPSTQLGDAAAATEAGAALQAQLAEAQSELAAQVDACTAAEARAEETQAAHAAAQRRIGQLAEELGGLRVAHAEARAEAEEEQARCSSLQEALHATQTAAGTAAAQQDELHSALASSHETRDQLQAQCNKLHLQVDSLKNQLVVSLARLEALEGGDTQGEGRGVPGVGNLSAALSRNNSFVFGDGGGDDATMASHMTNAASVAALQAEHDDLLVLLAVQDFEHSAFESALRAKCGETAVQEAREAAAAAQEEATRGEGGTSWDVPAGGGGNAHVLSEGGGSPRGAAQGAADSHASGPGVFSAEAVGSQASIDSAQRDAAFHSYQHHHEEQGDRDTPIDGDNTPHMEDDLRPRKLSMDSPGEELHALEAAAAAAAAAKQAEEEAAAAAAAAAKQAEEEAAAAAAAAAKQAEEEAAAAAAAAATQAEEEAAAAASCTVREAAPAAMTSPAAQPQQFEDVSLDTPTGGYDEGVHSSTATPQGHDVEHYTHGSGSGVGILPGGAFISSFFGGVSRGLSAQPIDSHRDTSVAGHAVDAQKCVVDAAVLRPSQSALMDGEGSEDDEGRGGLSEALDLSQDDFRGSSEPPVGGDAMFQGSSEPPVGGDAMFQGSSEPPVGGDAMFQGSSEPPVGGGAMFQGSSEPPVGGDAMFQGSIASEGASQGAPPTAGFMLGPGAKKSNKNRMPRYVGQFVPQALPPSAAPPVGGGGGFAAPMPAGEPAGLASSLIAAPKPVPRPAAQGSSAGFSLFGISLFGSDDGESPDASPQQEHDQVFQGFNETAPKPWPAIDTDGSGQMYGQEYGNSTPDVTADGVEIAPPSPAAGAPPSTVPPGVVSSSAAAFFSPLAPRQGGGSIGGAFGIDAPPKAPVGGGSSALASSSAPPMTSSWGGVAQTYTSSVSGMLLPPVDATSRQGGASAAPPQPELPTAQPMPPVGGGSLASSTGSSMDGYVQGGTAGLFGGQHNQPIAADGVFGGGPSQAASFGTSSAGMFGTQPMSGTAGKKSGAASWF